MYLTRDCESSLEAVDELSSTGICIRICVCICIFEDFGCGGWMHMSLSSIIV